MTNLSFQPSPELQEILDEVKRLESELRLAKHRRQELATAECPIKVGDRGTAICLVSAQREVPTQITRVGFVAVNSDGGVRVDIAGLRIRKDGTVGTQKVNYISDFIKDGGQ